jgi:hypothetical protein
MLRQLIEAHRLDDIAQLEAATGTSRREAAKYAIEQSDRRNCFTDLAGYKGGPGPGSRRLGDFQVSPFYIL